MHRPTNGYFHMFVELALSQAEGQIVILVN